MSENLYTTTDFYTAALLISLGYRIVHTISQDSRGNPVPNGRIKCFAFQDTEHLREDILCYMNKEKEGNLRAFRDAIETVKDIVHSG